ncbi:unnamed protein product [Cochlearia groenlandica]
MARETQYPCDSDGVCMRCKVTTPTEESLSCITCASIWHVPCLSSPPESLEATRSWLCPDCSGGDDVDPSPEIGGGSDGGGSGLVAEIREIEADESLTEAEKAKKRQQLMMKGKAHVDDDDDDCDGDVALFAIRESLKCSICIQLLERPVTTPCGHNFCLKCFEKWIRQGKSTCAKCRKQIPKNVAKKPLINYAMVSSIRMVKVPKRVVETPADNVHHFIRNEDLPDSAFRTERAKNGGRSNAKDGKIFVTVASDHFGPIPPENDPIRSKGVLVGESWADRHDCKQWGVHRETIAGICGQSKVGAQSVALSGGYVDDVDNGEWFLYTGSGGRDLSRNRRTNDKQSSDQKFTRRNEALKLSCKMGYPVRVVRSAKAKQSAYAPMEGVRYDGVYRIEKCWRKTGIDGFLICRFLFVRCDNEPAPWTSGDHGDRPRPLPDTEELENCTGLFTRTESPSWDFDEVEGCWKWMKSPPASKALVGERRKRKRKVTKERGNLMKELSCQICRKIMSLPVTTPCAHNFCKACLEAKFAGITQMSERSIGGRTLRAKKNVMACPCCPSDLSDFLQNHQVNIGLMDVIEKFKKEEEKPVVDDDTPNSEEDDEEDEDEENEEEEETRTLMSEVEPTRKKLKLDVVDIVGTSASE